MNCSKVLELVHLFVSGDCDSETALSIDSHAKQCVSCSDRIHQVRRFMGALSNSVKITERSQKLQNRVSELIKHEEINRNTQPQLESTEASLNTNLSEQKLVNQPLRGIPDVNFSGQTESKSKVTPFNSCDRSTQISVRFGAWLIGVAAVLFISLGIAIYFAMQPRVEIISGVVTISDGRIATTDQKGTVMLIDKSVAKLEPNTELVIVNERTVRLVKGSAFFDVTLGSEQFKLVSGAGEVRVLGTKFLASVEYHDRIGGYVMKPKNLVGLIAILTIRVLQGQVEVKNDHGCVSLDIGGISYVVQDKEPLKMDDETRKVLEEILGRLGNNDPEIRDKAQAELEKYLDSDAKAEFVKKLSSKYEVEVQARVDAAITKFHERNKKALQGKIVFRRPRLGWDIFSVNFDGTDVQNMTNGGTNHLPIYTPDRKHVLYLCEDKFWRPQLCIMDVDGKNKKIIKSDGYNLFPSFSPDGKKILFCRYENIVGCNSIQGHGGIVPMRRPGPTQIYTIDIDGSNLKQLTFEGYNIAPRFSPDGKHIVFTHTDKSGKDLIYMMDSEGKNKIQLTSKGNDEMPVFFPEGNSVLFLRHVSKLPSQELYDVYKVNIKDMTEKELATNVASYPLFSPDGSRILVTRDYNLCLIDLDGKDEQVLVKNVSSKPSAFTFDGKQILFTANRKGTEDLYIIDIDGKNETLVFEDASYPTVAPPLKK